MDHKLLECLMGCGLVVDSKELVDMPLRYDPEVIKNKWNKNKEDGVEKFIKKFFSPAGSDLLCYKPPDFCERPPLMDMVPPEYKEWVFMLNHRWKDLIKKVCPNVKLDQKRHSLLWKTHPFIVPGGRFREGYYWDTYWSILGLMACGMFRTALDIVYGLVEEIHKYGFIPNGNRSYYLNRSQPPFFSEMVVAIVCHQHNNKKNIYNEKIFICSMLEALEIEYSYWTDDDKRSVRLPDGCVLHKYHFEETLQPRPEAYQQDVLTQQKSGTNPVYNDIIAATGSGWDFSSRWIVGGKIATTNIVPVDLNSILFRMEKNIAWLYKKICKNDRAQKFIKLAEERKKAMNRHMWNEHKGWWKDIILLTNYNEEEEQRPVCVSNFSPLWAGLIDKNDTLKKQRVVDAFLSCGLDQEGGIMTTDYINTGEQWDGPNAFPPLQAMMIEGLHMVGFHNIADEITDKWVRANYLGYKKTGEMHEKYNALTPGKRGGGGEYEPQTGFAWTNGVVLHLLATKHLYNGQHY